MTSVFEGRPSDVVLFIVGGSGAGKSTLINHVLGAVSQACGTRMIVGEGLEPCTRAIQPIRLLPTISHSPKELAQVVLVDGPGLEDDDVAQHLGVIKATSCWLSKHYPRTLPRRGIIFLQDFSVYPLISSASSRNAQFATSLGAAIQCGDILLMPTKLGNMTMLEYDRAVASLSQQTWKSMIDAGIPFHSTEPALEKSRVMAAIQHFLPLPEAPLTDPGRDDDIVLMVMGPIKSGKSTFVNSILERCGLSASMPVSHDLTSCTLSVQSAIVPPGRLPGVEARRLVLVDTPGFEADDLENIAVLRMIKKWAEERFSGCTTSCAIVYFHDVSQDSFSRTATRILELFQRLIHTPTLRKVFLVTTKWDKHLKTACISREVRLLSQDWSGLIARGHVVRRLLEHADILDVTSNSLELLNEVLQAFS